MKCFSAGDLEGIVSDYSADAVFFTPNGPLKGHDQIREFFRALIQEFGQPGTHDMATDTHVVRDGKIVAQSFAAQIRPKR